MQNKNRNKMLLIASFVVALIVNLQSMIFGNAATILNLMVSLLFVFVWGAVEFNALKNDEFDLVLPIAWFWGLGFLTTLLAIFSVTADREIGLLFPLVFVFGTPLYGLSYLANNPVSRYILMGTVQFIGMVFAVLALMKQKSRQA